VLLLFYTEVWQPGESELEADLSPAAFAGDSPGCISARDTAALCPCGVWTRELIKMLVSSSPWPLPLCRLLLVDTPAEVEENRRKYRPESTKKKEGWGKGKERKDAKNSIKGKGGKYSRE